MAKCNICGLEAGYLLSICDSCKPQQPTNGVNAAKLHEMNPLRIAPGHRATPLPSWLVLLSLVVGIPSFIFLSMLAYGFSVPKYKHEARQVRDVCMQYLANADRRHICEENYEKAIQEGEAAESKR